MSITPMNRKETFLDGIANGTEVTLEPMTREEVYLKKIADGGGSGGGVLVVTLSSPASFPKKASHTFEEIKEAYDNGITVMFVISSVPCSFSKPEYTEAQSGGTPASFRSTCMYYNTSGVIKYCNVKIDSTDTVTSENIST